MGRPARATALPAMQPAERAAAELDRIGTVITCRKGHTLVEEGDPAEHVFKVKSGVLRAVSLLPDGRRCIGNFLLPGDFLGLTDDESYSHSIEAMAECELIRYTRSSFEAMLDRDPRNGHRFFDVMRKELSAVQDHLMLLSRKSAVERLASFLLTFADRNVGAGAVGNRHIELPMNRADMGDYLALRVETISRLLQVLKNRRIIDLPTSHSVALLRKDVLRQLSEGNR